ncbi:MAG: hypothetical protein K2I95_07175, partial [Treponemataceae bacterium]|nr:hypothetical protein [Treponemataceae bacterium]
MMSTYKNAISGKTLLKMWREAAGNARLLYAAIFPRIKAADSENPTVITQARWGTSGGGCGGRGRAGGRRR